MTFSARYVVPMLALSILLLSFFLPRRFRPLPRWLALTLRILAALPLVASGILHLAQPQVFVDLLPPPFPRQAWLIVATGFPELLGAIGLLLKPTRRLASVCLAIFMVAIFPANIYIAGQVVHGLPMPGVPVRTLMQGVYILLLFVAGWGWPVYGPSARRAL